MILNFEDMLNRCRVLENTRENNDYVKSYGREVKLAIDNILNNIETKQQQLSRETEFLASLNGDQAVSNRVEIRDLIESYKHWLRT